MFRSGLFDKSKVFVDNEVPQLRGICLFDSEGMFYEGFIDSCLRITGIGREDYGNLCRKGNLT